MKRPGIRFTGGEHRGRRLEMPMGDVRPTEGRVREALFSMWQSRLHGNSILDLFAGSGAVGLEAIGRGAERATLVEGSSKVMRRLMSNCETFAPGRARVIKRRLPANVPELARGFDLIFADPPYSFELVEELLNHARGWIVESGELALEHSRRRILPEQIPGWRLRDLRCYGESCLSFFQPELGDGELPER